MASYSAIGLVFQLLNTFCLSDFEILKTFYILKISQFYVMNLNKVGTNYREPNDVVGNDFYVFYRFLKTL